MYDHVCMCACVYGPMHACMHVFMYLQMQGTCLSVGIFYSSDTCSLDGQTDKPEVPECEQTAWSGAAENMEFTIHLLVIIQAIS